MTGPTLHGSVLVTNPEGFHLRPAARFARTVKELQCSVCVRKGEERADGLSVLSLLALGALPGTELIVEVSGPNASNALSVLVELVNAPAEEF